MRAAHFPDDLLSFLQMESLVAGESVARYGCDAIVELGCYDGRALEVARFAGVRYLGVDVNGRAIDALRRRIADEGVAEQAAAIQGNALHSEEWQPRLPGQHPLQLVPFNLLGNFLEPAALLRAMRAVGGTAVVSVFNAQRATTEVRRAYYSACGIDYLTEEPGPYGGVLFRGADGFQSQSFSGEGFHALMAEAGIRIVDESANRFGRYVTVQFT
ncbi:L-histidine N(alpha)-methyltransferase [Streptomyces caniferus]|nr:L-histidine N(alpha)-methyltransferase [Streptomyces caniferus]